MDTNNLQQINNFADGMNTDTSDAVLSESSYRLANNLRFITNTDENSGELHMIEGASRKHQFFRQTIIGTTNLRNVPVYVTVTEGNSTWAVWYDKQLVALIPAKDGRVIGHEHKLSLVTRYESDTNKKLYIADGEGPVLCVQLYLKNREDYARDLREVESIPSVLFKKPIFCGLIDGNIKAAVVEYSYQFYKKYGQQSEVSPSTKLIPLFKGGTTAKESSKILGYLPEQQSDKGVKIKIPYDINTISPFDRIKVFRISYIEMGQIPQIECVYDEDIKKDSNELVIEDKGLSALAVYSLEEYNAMTGIHVIPNTIESKDDYLFAANVKDESTGFDIKNWTTEGNVFIEDVTVNLVGDDSINPDYVVSKPTYHNYSGRIVEQKTLGNSIQTSDDDSFILSDYIDSTEDVLSYHNPQASYMFKSLRRGETYRFGVIFYDNKGRSSGVIHIEDHTVPANDFFSISEDYQLIVKPAGVKVTITSFPEGAVSYEIVRSGRSISDMSTITQGFLTRPIRQIIDQNWNKETYPLTPTGLVTIHNSIWSIYNNEPIERATNYDYDAGGVHVDGCYDTYSFISPEICYQNDTIKDYANKYELQIQPIKWVCPLQFIGNSVEGVQTIEFNEPNVPKIDRINYGNKYAFVGKCSDSGWNSFFVHGAHTIALDYLRYNGTEQQTINLTHRQDFVDNWYGESEARFSYAKLYYSYSNDNANKNKIEAVVNKSYAVDKISFPETLLWDDFATNDAEKFELIYTGKITTIGSQNFINWVCGPLQGLTYQTNPNIDIVYLDDGSYSDICSMGPGGKCSVLKIADPNRSIVDSVPEKALICTYICNLKKKSVLPDIKNTTYRSFGDYFIIGEQEESKYIFDGDCFIQPFEYVAQHKFAHSSSKYWRTACRIFTIPLETSINLAYTSGFEFNREFDSANGNVTYIQDKSSNINNIFVQDTPLYAYNTAYSTTDTSRTLVSRESITDTDESELNTDCRVFHSNVKTNNEYIDSWLKYMPANFLDVDSRKGPITGLRTFKNQLVFWQEYAAGVLSVNERSVISDESNMPLILGSGGVLTRFDYFTNVNGMHEHDYSDAQSNTTLYWWDRINKSIVGYSGGQDAIELSKIKFVQNYLNKNKAEDYPLLAYDNKTKEIVANVVTGEDHEIGSLVYNEHLGHFTSLYTIKPEYKVELPDGLLFTKSHDVYDWNKQLDKKAKGLEGEPIYPYLKHVVNHAGQYTKVFDNAEFAGRVYGGDKHENGSYDLSPLKLKFSTPLKQNGELEGNQIENREYNFRYVIPRNNGSEYGDRLRGKTMQCELESTNNSYDFSLQFIKTKFRISWS